MCGRYTLSTPAGRLAEEFELNSAVEISPSYNVAPTQQVAAVLEDEAGRRLEMLRWGLVPSWADDPGIGARMINARSETAPEKPSFRRAFRGRRCLIAADGFYEWKRENGGKQPYYFRMQDSRPFAFAGLWESWEKGGDGALRIVRDPDHQGKLRVERNTREDARDPTLRRLRRLARSGRRQGGAR